jgi:hypothetical protein
LNVKIGKLRRIWSKRVEKSQMMKRILLSLFLALMLTPLTPLQAGDGVLLIAEDRPQGYDRSLFKHWIDADKNGCDTRKEVLIEEAVTKPKIGKKCALSGGRWVSPYDGKSHKKDSGLDVDHLVPLAEAWRSGAWAWTPGERQSFANDLTNSAALVAVTNSVNRSKGDRDPAGWLPKLEKCQYLSDWINIKLLYKLTVDNKEVQAIQSQTSTCSLPNVTFVNAEPNPSASSAIPTPTPQPRLSTPTISMQDGNWAEIFIPGFAPGITIATPIRVALSKVNKDDRGGAFLNGRCRFNSRTGPEWGGSGSELPVTPITIYCLIRDDIEFDLYAYTFIGETKINSEKVSMRVGNPSNIPPTPTPVATTNQTPTVSPGAFCSPAGAIGVSSSGVQYTCKTSSTDSRNRWRQ